ncbi:hypothetical protein HNQ68_001146 [Pseudochrobactrum saccharolyticum]|uniref:Right handed beta helix domain-containing protein n=1 Tax=Pseudochrobactrum saccharolyticum TaxID=354352 RepID=A0A7W8AHQ4_9HYPH|nr:right-handed parallel beta-helix repeat-containing protein [Pseudochrobactrum saccharolyticum]KAB0539333.1 hypothetical protein F7P81_09965 [Pseudochrobactrum saccharolyticum]MBB5090622.1 hypothetical protein [Pseudochrobactrum saccharolyticum]
MTVPVPDQLEYISDADGTTTEFPYPKRFLQSDEIVVLLRDADGVDTQQYLNQHYSIAGSAWPNGGAISFYVAPAVGVKVVRYRMTQAKQTVDLENRQRNDAPSVELQLDRTVMAIQDTRRSVSKLEAMSDEIGLAQGYAEQAAEARDSARDAREDAERAAERNWFAFETRDQVALTIVPSSTHYIRTAGESMRGDGKGGLYIDEPNGTANTVDSLDGRTWYKVVDVEAERVLQAPAYTRMTARIVADALSGQPISPFHFGGNGLAIDQSNALQNALEFTLLDDTNPQSCTLDLVGRNWRTNKGLTIRDVPKTKRTIQNGQLTAIGAYADEALLDIRPTANGGAGGSNTNWVNALKIKDVHILGGQSAGAVLVNDSIAVKNAHGVVIEGCYLQWFRGHGVIDYTDRAATETIVRHNRIVGAYGNSEGVRISGADAEIGGKNMISNCRRGIVSLMHSVNIEYNHIYDCTDASIYYNDTAALCQGNYIDNAPIVICNPRGLFTGNKFLRALTSPMGEGSAFVVLFPAVPSLFVQGFNFQDNSFANTAGGQVKMFAVNESKGSIGSVYSSIVDGNTISSVTGSVLPQRSRPRGRLQISASVSGDLDMSSQLPFGRLRHAEVTWNKDSASSVIPAVAVTNISDAGVVTIGLSQAATGRAYIRGDISEFV